MVITAFQVLEMVSPLRSTFLRELTVERVCHWATDLRVARATIIILQIRPFWAFGTLLCHFQSGNIEHLQITSAAMPKRKCKFTDELKKKYPCFRLGRDASEAECMTCRAGTFVSTKCPLFYKLKSGHPNLTTFLELVRHCPPSLIN